MLLGSVTSATEAQTFTSRIAYLLAPLAMNLSEVNSHLSYIRNLLSLETIQVCL
jgi:hypothetical protein